MLSKIITDLNGVFMNNIFKSMLLLIVLFISSEVMALDCEGRFDFNDDYAPIHKKIQLHMSADNTAFQMFEGQIDLFHYSVTLYNNNTYNLGIYMGPDYTEGTRVSGSLALDTNLRLSYVKGQSALNIICK
jgi:hypothetical protein